MGMNLGFSNKLSMALDNSKESAGNGVQTAEFYNRWALELSRIIPLDFLVKQMVSADHQDHHALYANSILLNSTLVGPDYLQLMVMVDALPTAYNLFVALYDRAKNIPLVKNAPAITAAADENIKQLLMYERHGLRKLMFADEFELAGRLFSNMVQVYGDAGKILPYMTITQIHACCHVLAEYGIDLIPPGKIPAANGNSRRFMVELDRDTLMSSFGLLREMHGPIKAQIMMDQAGVVGQKDGYLSCRELETIWHGDPAVFLEKALCAHENVTGGAVRWTVQALRREDRLPELDELPAKTLKKLMDREVLSTDDLDMMPKALKAFRRQKITADFGL